MSNFSQIQRKNKLSFFLEEGKEMNLNKLPNKKGYGFKAL